MKLFLTGPTGYIGSAVAQAFRRAGYEVLGLVQDEKPFSILAMDEIQGVVGDLQDPNSYRRYAEESDVLIHCAADYDHDWAKSDRQTMEALLSASQRGSRRKTVVFTSGSWVYGNTGGRPVTETAPLSPAKIGSHRPQVEQIVIRADNARGLVIRPANLYGRREGMLRPWMEAASQGRAPSVAGDGSNRWAMVHVDDLALGYLQAVESSFSGEIFHFNDGSRYTVRELVEAVMQAAGFNGQADYITLPKANETIGPNAEVVAMDFALDSSKAEGLLNWKPRHTGFVELAETYFKAWKAWAAVSQRINV